MNPYAENAPTGHQLFAGVDFLKYAQKRKRNTRYELAEYLCSKLNPSRIKDGYKPLNAQSLLAILKHRFGHSLSITDIAWLKSSCEQEEARGRSFPKVFWWTVKDLSTGT